VALGLRPRSQPNYGVRARLGVSSDFGWSVTTHMVWSPDRLPEIPGIRPCVIGGVALDCPQQHAALSSASSIRTLRSDFGWSGIGAGTRSGWTPRNTGISAPCEYIRELHSGLGAIRVDHPRLNSNFLRGKRARCTRHQVQVMFELHEDCEFSDCRGVNQRAMSP
jgi:hypothetical protein